MYIYRVDSRQYSARIQVGIYDPERSDGAGGFKFGFEAKVYVSVRTYVGDIKVIAEVSQAAIGSHSPEDALQRIDVYQQAADIARFINDQIATGAEFEDVVRFLDDALPQVEPAASGFKCGVYQQAADTARFMATRYVL